MSTGTGPRARRRARRRWRGALATTAILAATVAVFGGGGAAIGALLVSSQQWASAPEAAGPEGAGAPVQPTPDPAASIPAVEQPSPPPVEQTPPPAEAAPPAAPVSPADTTCATSTTMSVWAHYDDDLIFMNPALGDAIAAGDCVRTVFLTGADAGKGNGYAKGRELGILRSYNTMRGQEGFWSEKRVTLLSGMVASQWSPDGDPDITVTFLRLPDGNLSGKGFPATGNVSLPQLVGGMIPALAPLDGGSPCTLEQLVTTVGELIGAYHANRLFTHVPSESAEWAPGDHPDHSATGTVARAAWQRIGYPAEAVNYLIGYPSMNLEANVGGDALSRKLAAFRRYAEQDSVVSCNTDAACLAKPKFGAWLQRHYVKSESELFPAG